MTNNNHSYRSNLIPLHAGYRHPRSYQVAQMIYDATVVFYDRSQKQPNVDNMTNVAYTTYRCRLRIGRLK